MKSLRAVLITLCNCLKVLASSKWCKLGDSSTRVLISSGCSGSTFVQMAGRNLMNMHGACLFPSMYEPFGDDRKRLEEKGRPSRKSAADVLMDELKKVRRTMHQPCAFKADLRDIVVHYPGFFKDLKHQIGVKFVYTYRSNSLDVYSCKVRDCFKPDWGHPVTSNGKQTGLCFGRRSKGVETLASIDTGKLLEKLKGMRDGARESLRELKKRFGPIAAISMENLTAHTQSNSTTDWHRGLNAWKTFLSAWGVTPNKSILEKVLQKRRGSHPLKSHKTSIYNFGEVEKALRGTEFYKDLRWR